MVESDSSEKEQDAATGGTTAGPPPPAAVNGAASSAPEAPANSAPPARDLGRDIERLKAEQAEARVARRLISKNLKNLERRKRRLKQKARQLSNQDLVQVLMLRQAPKSADDQPPDAAGAAAEDASPVPTDPVN